MAVVSPTAVAAECSQPSADDIRQREVFQLAFSGKVAEARWVGRVQELVIDVDRVWKGNVPRRLLFYGGFLVEEPRLQAGEIYFVLATAMSAAERRLASIPPRAGVVYKLLDCGAWSPEDPHHRGIVSALGHGSPPE